VLASTVFGRGIVAGACEHINSPGSIEMWEFVMDYFSRRTLLHRICGYGS